MRLLFAFAVMAMATLSTPAHAIDCPRATSHIDHMICSDPKLLRADAAMNQAYAAILKAAPDAEIRAMLVTSQKRWIKARDSSFGDLDNGTNGMTGYGYSKVLQHSLVLHATVDRTSDLGMSDKNPKRRSLIHTALEQRRFAAQFTGGPFAGFETNCSFLPRQAVCACALLGISVRTSRQSIGSSDSRSLISSPSTSNRLTRRATAVAHPPSGPPTVATRRASDLSLFGYMRAAFASDCPIILR